MSGCTPAPITTKSQSISSPDFVTTCSTRPPEPSKRSSSWEPCTFTPCSVEHVLEEAADLRTVEALVRDRLEHDQLALLAELRERRRQLGPDVAAADQRDALGAARAPRAARRSCASCAGSGCRPARAPSACRMRTFEPVASSALSKRDLLLVRELRDARVEVERHHARARQQLDALLLVPARPAGTGCPRATPRRAGSLRERRPVVGRVGLAPDDQDLALGALLAQVARAVGGGEAAADQQELDRPLRPSVRGSGRSRPRSARPCPPAGSARRPRSHAAPGAGDQVDEPLPGLGREDRVRVGEADERRLLPRRKRARATAFISATPGSLGRERDEQRERRDAGLRLGVRPRRLVGVDDLLRAPRSRSRPGSRSRSAGRGCARRSCATP